MEFMTKLGVIIGINIIGAGISCYVNKITREKANEEFMKTQLENIKELEKMGKTEDKELKELVNYLEEVEKLNKGK